VKPNVGEMRERCLSEEDAGGREEYEGGDYVVTVRDATATQIL